MIRFPHFFLVILLLMLFHSITIEDISINGAGSEKPESLERQNLEKEVSRVVSLQIAVEDDLPDASLSKQPDPDPIFSLVSVLDYLSEPEIEIPRKEITPHTVQQGETLNSIADSYNISTETIMWANELNSVHFIKFGDVLRIPPMDGTLHTVSSGESLSFIASLYSVSQGSIINANGLANPNHIFQSQRLLIPGAQPIDHNHSHNHNNNHNNNPRIVSTQTPYSYPDLGEGYFIRPTTGRISQGLHPHNAVDIDDVCGVDVFASADGIVDIVSKGNYRNTGYGNYVLINHSDTVKTLYAHLSSIVVSKSKVVSRGELIGYMGNTGYSIGAADRCHLHFEVHGAKNPFL